MKLICAKIQKSKWHQRSAWGTLSAQRAHTSIHTHTSTRARTQVYTNIQVHPRTHTNAHTHTHTQAQMWRSYCRPFPLELWADHRAGHAAFFHKNAPPKKRKIGENNGSEADLELGRVSMQQRKEMKAQTQFAYSSRRGGYHISPVVVIMKGSSFHFFSSSPCSSE